MYKKIMSRGDAEDTIKVDRERLMIRSERVSAENATKSARIETRVNYPNDEN